MLSRQSPFKERDILLIFRAWSIARPEHPGLKRETWATHANLVIRLDSETTDSLPGLAGCERFVFICPDSRFFVQVEPTAFLNTSRLHGQSQNRGPRWKLKSTQTILSGRPVSSSLQVSYKTRIALLREFGAVYRSGDRLGQKAK